MKQRIKAVIFDFDGVIVDSASLHEAAWNEIAKKHGYTITHQLFRAGFGVKNERFIAEIVRWTDDSERIQGIIREKEHAFQRLLTLHGMPLIKGIEEFLNSLQAASVPFAIGSSAVLENIRFMLSCTQLGQKFPLIVSAEEVIDGKPHPDVFLKAATLLKIAPENCVVFEDAPLGGLAAKNAGMPYILLTTTFSKEELQQWPLTPLAYWDSFQNKSVADIRGF